MAQAFQAVRHSHCKPCNLVAATLFAAVIMAMKISQRLKQAAHGDATVRSSTIKMSIAAILYYYQAHLLVRETLWWWLALARNRCGDGLPLLAILTMMMYYIFENNHFLTGFR